MAQRALLDVDHCPPHNRISSPPDPQSNSNPPCSTESLDPLLSSTTASVTAPDDDELLDGGPPGALTTVPLSTVVTTSVPGGTTSCIPLGASSSIIASGSLVCSPTNPKEPAPSAGVDMPDSSVACRFSSRGLRSSCSRQMTTSSASSSESSVLPKRVKKDEMVSFERVDPGVSVWVSGAR